MSDQPNNPTIQPQSWTEEKRTIPNSGQEFDALLQGRDAWWEFMEAKSRGEALGQPDDISTEGLELQDVGRLATRHEVDARPKFEPHHTTKLQCERCSAQVPADLTLCVYCGAKPRYTGRHREQLLIIDALDAQSAEEVARLITASNAKLEPAEVKSALAAPPAVFSFRGQEDHARVLTERLGELGVQAKVSAAGAPEVSMGREVAESIARRPVYLIPFLIALVLAAAIGTATHPFFGIFVAICSWAGLLWNQRNVYQARYAIDVEQILNALTGFDAEMIEGARTALSSIQDKEVRDLLTVCLIEYYATWRHLAAADPSLRRTLDSLREGLDDLVRQIVTTCLKYAELHNYLKTNDPSGLRAEIQDLDATFLRTSDPGARALLSRKLEQRHQQLLTLERVESLLPRVRQQLFVMCASMESLRARVVSMTLTHSTLDEQEISLDAILQELDDEVLIFEQTVDEVLEDPAYHF